MSQKRAKKTVTRVMIEWPQHGRHGWIGDISHYEETMMGPLAHVVFGNGESGLYQHEYLRIPPSSLSSRTDGGR